jgi:hypothetical protein
MVHMDVPEIGDQLGKFPLNVEPSASKIARIGIGLNAER